ncbi:protein kinase [Endozoicomonas sp. 4G]|uniref:protein kinase n=1 Tax=Endozoicomonas sp. 4G TaxID=2872754 RepID=UPI0020791398|nr:protein kinase [Endozoicomonas sp. 4G]
MDLSQVASGAPLLLNDSAWLKSVMQQIASAMRTLHDHHFIHIDFHWRNILVTQSNKPKIALIDCPSGDRLPYPLYKRGIIKDLACLDKTAKHVLSKTKRLKFYKIYKQRQKLDDSDKQQIRKILKFFEGR